MPLYPLKFEPIFKPAPWGGARLRARLGRPPESAPTGEAWLLSDIDGSASVVANGPLAGASLRDVLAAHGPELLGPDAPPDGRFPLLLKLLDARRELSVQVHPDDARAVELEGPGHRGKTEAWVILDADPAASLIYAGFRAGVSAADFRAALAAGAAPGTLHHFTPEAGDCVFLPAGTVHAVGADILLFEVQQTSDITYRLYDWGRVDAAGNPRRLDIERGLSCADFARGPCDPVAPREAGGRETLVECPQFTLHRAVRPRAVGRAGRCTAAVCVEGSGTVAGESVGWGEVVLLPAPCAAAPVTGAVTLLECGF